MSEEMSDYVADNKLKRPSGQHHSLRLQDQVRNPKLWPTPTSRDWKDGRKVYDRKKDGTATQDTLGRRLAAMGETVSGQLSPMWVEWLMGFPSGWTGLED
jgi:hypothetical protein